jgi:hypothetical protein
MAVNVEQKSRTERVAGWWKKKSKIGGIILGAGAVAFPVLAPFAGGEIVQFMAANDVEGNEKIKRRRKPINKKDEITVFQEKNAKQYEVFRAIRNNAYWN